MLVKQPRSVEHEALREEVQVLLSESVEAAEAREQSEFERLAGGKADSIVLFGAGGLGRRCLAALRRGGVEPLAFADNNPRAWHTTMDGVAVLPPQDAVRRFGDSAVFVISIWGARGSDRIGDRVAAVRSLGCKYVAPFGPMLWRFHTGSLPHYTVDRPHLALEQKAAIQKAFDLWSDVASAREFVAQLRWRLTFDSSEMSAPDVERIYFPPDLIALQNNEVFVDCGAFDGDTVKQFVAASGAAFGKLVAFEPDPANFAKLNEAIRAFPDSVHRRIETAPFALAATKSTVRFAAEGSPASHVGDQGVEIQAVALDEYLGDTRASFIKMDIEGAEPDALSGAAAHIAADNPTLAVSCYHRQDHLWTIPLLMSALNDRYSFHLRPHDLDSWDLVCYAISPDRAVATGAR